MPFLTIDDRNLFYVAREAKGTKRSCTLLFIHGLGSSHAFYESVIPQFTNAGFDCIAFDTPGSGLSTIGPENHGIKGFAGDAEHLLSSLHVKLNSVIVVGHSMGTLIAAHLAARPGLHKAAGLVLIGPISPSPALAEVFSKRIETVRQGGMETMADTIPYAATGSQSTSLHHAFIRALLLSQTVDGYTSLCSAIANADGSVYTRVEAPSLVIAGEEDQTSKLEMAQYVTDCFLIEYGELKVLKGVGHWHCIEAPEKVVEAIKQFASDRAS